MTTDLWIAVALVALVVCERLAELVISARNQKRLIASGGIEIGAAHYPYMVLLHVAWMGAIVAWVAAGDVRVSAPMVVAHVLVELARVWVMTSLGPYWTTRIITVPDAPLIARGPYRFVRHPNYVVVTIEIALLPVALGAWWIALLFSILNALMLRVRIAAENEALAARSR